MLPVAAVRRRILLAAGLLGAGLMGVLDAAVFHFLLQWHHFVETPDPSDALRADGGFLLAMAGLCAWGAGLALRTARRASERFETRGALGAALVGAGSLNLLDLLVDHLLLRLHSLHPSGAPGAELAWGLFSATLVLLGVLRIKRRTRQMAGSRALA